MMPKGGGPVRAEQMATTTRLSHNMFVSDEIGRLLDELREFEKSLPPESDEASLIRVARLDWEKTKRVPPELAAETAKARASGYQAWVKARPENDFASFLPYLEKLIELKRTLYRVLSRRGRAIRRAGRRLRARSHLSRDPHGFRPGSRRVGSARQARDRAGRRRGRRANARLVPRGAAKTTGFADSRPMGVPPGIVPARSDGAPICRVDDDPGHPADDTL